jgi:hypothetical protein
MVTTIANDVSVTVIYVENDALAHYLVEEAMKVDHTPFISGSGILMDHMMHPFPKLVFDASLFAFSVHLYM